MIVPSNVPVSVALGRACAICWRPFGNGIHHHQSLDGVHRDLCTTCATKLFPVGLDAEVVHMEPGAGYAQVSCVDCGREVTALPGDQEPRCIECSMAAGMMP